MHVLVDDAPQKVDPEKVKAKKRKKNLILIGSSVGLVICMAVGIYFMFLQPAPAPQPVAAPVDLSFKITTMYELGINPAAASQKVIKITHNGGEIVQNISKQLWITMYPPEDTPYLPRSPAIFSSKYTTFTEGDELYVYYDTNQQARVTKTIPSYSEYIDFPNGKWEVHIDDARYKVAMSSYKFTITDSRTHLVKVSDDISLSKLIAGSQPYDTIILYGSDKPYHEQVVIDKPMRIIGINNPTIDGGGVSSVITIANTTDVLIQGLKVQNSGAKYPEDAAILIKGSTKINIRNNTISESQNGVYLYQSSECNIYGNSIYSNVISGIAVGYNSNKNTLKNNMLQLNTMGIYIPLGSDDNYIVSNNGFGNSRYGIFVGEKLHNVYEYNNFTDTMSYDNNYDNAIALLYTDYSNNDLWGTPRSNLCGMWGTPGPSDKDYTNYSSC
jgi:parallel beta-helix repeat protein